MLQNVDDIRQVIRNLIKDEIETLRGIDHYVVTGVNEDDLTVNVKRLNTNESHDRVEILGLGLGNGKGQIKLPNVEDVVVCAFIMNSQRPIVLGTHFDVFSVEKDAKLDVRRNEYFVNNRVNGTYLFFDESDNVTIKTPSGAKIRLSTDGSFKLFNKDNYGVECDASGNLTFRGLTITNTQTTGSF